MFSILAREPDFLRKMLKLSVPIILQNLLTQALGLVDTVMVGRLGEQELSGVALVNTIFFIVMLFVFGVQSGGAVLISQYWGKTDTRAINMILGISAAAAGGITFIFALVVTLFPLPVMNLVTSDTALAACGAEYARIVAFSYFFNSLALVYIGAQRSIQNPRLGLVVLGVSMSLNTVLNYAFIFGRLGAPELGVKGAALATLISRAFELALVVFAALRASNCPFSARSFFRPRIELVRDFLKYSLPVIFNETLWGLGFSLYPIILGHLPEASGAVAAYTIANSMERIGACVQFGVGHAGAVTIGKRLGSGTDSPDYAYKTGQLIIFISTMTGVISGVVFIGLIFSVLRPFVFPFFTMSAMTESLAVAMLIANGSIFPVRALNFSVIVGVLRGGGDVRASLLIDLSVMYLLTLPLAAIGALQLGLGAMWVYAMLCCDEILKLPLCLWRVSRRKWVKNVTRQL